jgi:glycosyltransferase involved in cell wall biosynthesis
VRILSITAGAAGMYCGSCFRDNALASELLRRGHDVTLVPVYTPTRTDEANVSQRRVLFGGISVYLQQYSSLFRKTPRLLDRLWDAPWVIGAFASRSVSTDPGMLGDLTVSMLEGTDGVLRKEFEKLVEWVRDEPLPDVINLPNSMLIAMAEPLRRSLGRPVCCTLQGEELFLDGLIEPYRTRALDLIRGQVRHVDRFIAVSDYCAAFMSDFLRIPRDRISVVPLGVDMAGYTQRKPSEGAFTIGYFARVAPEKGLLLLADAYVRFRRLGGTGRLVAAGYMAGDQAAYLKRVEQQLTDAGLGGEFSYRGEVDRAGKVAFLNELDVLSVPATYDEPKGLFLIEAMAAGVPVVEPRRGGLTEIVERTGGGLLVTPDDPDSLAEGLHRLWAESELRRTLGQRAFHGIREHYTIARSAERLLEAYGAAINTGTRPHATRVRHTTEV